MELDEAVGAIWTMAEDAADLRARAYPEKSYAEWREITHRDAVEAVQNLLALGMAIGDMTRTPAVVPPQPL